MEIATIVPTPHLHQTAGDPYLMALAHVVQESPTYSAWFRSRTREGAFVLLDNGAAENGEGLSIKALLDAALAVRASQIILPDAISDAEQTLRLGKDAVGYPPLRYPQHLWSLMAVPQGRTAEEYLDCVREMTRWPIQALGITRFLINTGIVTHRREILGEILEITDGKLDLHLLGCPNDPIEAYEIEQTYPGAVRGTDSGIAAIFTQEGLRLGLHPTKPAVDLNFSGDLDPLLLDTNIRAWRRRVKTGRWN